MFCGRGRFFYMSTTIATRPVVAVIKADATDRRTLCSLLESLDVVVKDYDSAESYLATHEAACGCVISEIDLPGMSGLDLVRHMRREGAPPPTILVGEHADVAAAVLAIREGAVDFVERPQIGLVLPRRVAQLLSRYRFEVSTAAITPIKNIH